MRIHRRTDLTLDDLAGWLNPIVAGWMNYYGRYYRSALDPLLQRVSTYLRRWAGEEVQAAADHKRFKRWWTGLLERAARPVRPLAVGPPVLTAGEKSPVTGDCHAGICGSPGVRFPRATRPRSPACRDGGAGRAGKAKAVIP